MKTITVLIDFTETAKKAARYGHFLAKKFNATLNLLHIAPHEDEDNSGIEEKMIEFAELKDADVKVTASVGDGDYREKIPRLLELSNADLVVVGTHGDQGHNPTLFGSEVVKLTQSISINALVIQDQTPEPADFTKMLFPIGPHKKFHTKIDAALRWARDFDLKINVFALSKENGSMADSITRNLKLAKDSFEEAGVDFVETVRPTKVYSVGYAHEIVEEAQAVGADLIASLSNPSKENNYFGNVDKSNIILNEKGIPVLAIANERED